MGTTTWSQIYPGQSSLDALLIALIHEKHGKPRLRFYPDGHVECNCGPNSGKGFCWQSAYVHMIGLALPKMAEEIEKRDSEDRRAEVARQLAVMTGIAKAQSYWAGREEQLARSHQ